MDEEEMLAKITRLLEQGCTMLATHHSCGAPLFRCKGEVVCPVCSFGAVAAGEAITEQSRKSPEGNAVQEASSQKEPRAPSSLEKAGPDDRDQGELGEAKKVLRTSILRRIRGLAERIENEQDLERLGKQLECADALLRVLRSLEGQHPE